MTIALTLPSLTPGINTLLRMHWAVRRAKQQVLGLTIISKVSADQRTAFRWNAQLLAPDKVHIHYIRYSKKQMDIDNLYGSFKLIGDALKDMGLIRDDSPDYIVLTCEHVMSNKSWTQLTLEIYN